MDGLKYSGNDVTKMPIIGTLKTRPLTFSTDDGNGFTIPSTIYKIVEIITDRGYKYYIVNQWYKNRIPLIIHQDMVDDYTPEMEQIKHESLKNLEKLIETIVRKKLNEGNEKSVNLKSFFKFMDKIVTKFNLIYNVDKDLISLHTNDKKVLSKLETTIKKSFNFIHNLPLKKLNVSRGFNNQINLWYIPEYGTADLLLTVPYSDKNVIDLIKNDYTNQHSLKSFIGVYLTEPKNKEIATKYILTKPTSIEHRNNVIYFKVKNYYILVEYNTSNNIGSYTTETFLGNHYDDNRKTTTFKDGTLLSKTILKYLKSKGVDIIPFLKGSKVQGKKQDILKQIASDFQSFRADGQRPNDIEIHANTVSGDFRHLGNWIDDEENSYEYEDPDSDSYDPGWREDNDNRIWAPGEYKRFMQKFNDWAKQYKWYKLVKLGIETSEKDWCSFEITLK